ncbi:MAG: IS21 family transposase [Gemmatimonadales bacterium]
MKNARERMDVIAAYREVGTYRGAAEICGTTHKTAKRIIEAHQAGKEVPPARAARARNYDIVAEVVAARVKKTSGRVSAKRLLPEAKVAGYDGSARNFRRLVAKAKRDWRADHHRGRRPAVWAPGEVLAIDWGSEGGLHVFCAVSAWSRWRFVRFAADERSETTFAMLAECFEEMGGAPKVVLADRMGCLKGGVVANVVVPTPAYVRFASHYSFRPDFCEGADPESKGIVENLVGYAKADLIVPQAPFGDLASANVAARGWCAEVNAALHSEICAVPACRLVTERPLFAPLPSLRPSFGRVTTRKVDKLSCVRFGSARYSVPNRLIGRAVEVRAADGAVRVVHLGEIVATHALVAPGEASVIDDHYGGPRRAPQRKPRPKTSAERAICGLGPLGEAFIKGAAAAGVTKLGSELADIAALEASHGREALTAALGRAVHFGRWRAGDVRSILAAGAGVARPTRPGEALIIDLPPVGTRPLSDYATGTGEAGA